MKAFIDLTGWEQLSLQGKLDVSQCRPTGQEPWHYVDLGEDDGTGRAEVSAAVCQWGDQVLFRHITLEVHSGYETWNLKEIALDLFRKVVR